MANRVHVKTCVYSFLLVCLIGILLLNSSFTSAFGKAKGPRGVFKFMGTFQITPDDRFLTGSFARVNYVPATDRFVVTFGTKASTVPGESLGAGYAYKEYTPGMRATGKAGLLLWYENQAEAGDSGSYMHGNDYYVAFVPMDPGHPYGWHIVKYNATNWTMLADTYFALPYPNEGNTDPMVAFIDGQLDVSDQYNPSGIWQEGSTSNHHFFAEDLQPIGLINLADTPHIDGASIIFVDGVYYFVSASSYTGDLIVMKYDSGWNYLGMKVLIQQAHWSQGIAFDGQRFYVAYLNTSQRTPITFFPVYPNVHLAAFDRDWNLVDDVAVTNFVPSDNLVGGRPWVIIHENRLYVSYDVDTLDPSTLQEELKWQAYVTIYQIHDI